MSISNFKLRRLASGQQKPPNVLPNWFEGQMPEADTSIAAGPSFNQNDPRNQSSPPKDDTAGSAFASQYGYNSWAKSYTWAPNRFPKVAAPLRVPKTIIISIFPFWTLATTETWQFMFPRDVIGNLLLAPGMFGNYYYLTQWDVYSMPEGLKGTQMGCNPSAQWRDRVQTTLVSNYATPMEGYNDPGSPNDYSTRLLTSDEVSNCLSNPEEGFGSAAAADGASTTSIQDNTNFTHMNQNYTEASIKKYGECTKTNIPTDGDPTKSSAMSVTATKGGYLNQVVATVPNPYVAYLKDFRENCQDAIRDFVHSLKPDGEWNVIFPEWIPYPYPELRNDYLVNQTYVYDGRDWIAATKPCAHTCPAEWGPGFPDPRGQSMPFSGVKVPWLLCPEPGFGVNVLHIYIGHANMAFMDGVNGYQGYQAWPFSPEYGYIGPDALWSYFPSWEQVKMQFLKYYWARRPAWRDYGYDYGYTGVWTVDKCLEYYSAIWQPAADQYRQNYLKYRNIYTKIYTFGESVMISWEPQNIEKDAQPACESPFFWMGFDTFGDYVAMRQAGSECAADESYTDRTEYGVPGHVAIGSMQNKTVSTCSIDQAIRFFFPPLRSRVDQYYASIEPGTHEFFIGATDGIDGVEYSGPAENSPSADWFIQIIKDFYGLKD